MAVVRWEDGDWGEPELQPVGPLSLHPASHALHYGSTCFEGLKAHRGVDDVVRIFRVTRHVERMRGSAATLMMPVPDTDLLAGMIQEVVGANLDTVPASPGSLYLRPTLIGTEPNIGAAAHPTTEALLFVLASPVGSYFANGEQALVLAIETTLPRTTPQFGSIKAGANYAMALGPTRRAVADFGADQVLFVPDGDVTETGAANILLLDGERVLTPKLTPAFLDGVTRASLLDLAADLDYEVEERTMHLDDIFEWAKRPDAEIALCGTAAVLTGVGELVHEGRRLPVGNGEIGPNTVALRRALGELQTGERPDPYGWTTPIEP